MSECPIFSIAARRMYADADKLPLLILVNPGLNGIYGCSGYNVGSVKMILELLRVNQAGNDVYQKG